jgi:hypothetical protein
VTESDGGKGYRKVLRRRSVAEKKCCGESMRGRERDYSQSEREREREREAERERVCVCVCV